MGTPLIVDHRLLFDQFNGIYRTVANTIPATNAFISVDLHKAKRVGLFSTTLFSVIVNECPLSVVGCPSGINPKTTSC
jgi:hypothetical protein